MDWYVIAGWLAAGVLLFVLFLAYSGAFHVVTFCYSQPYKGELAVAYFHAQGQYRGCGALCAKVSNMFGGKLPTFGLYQDNPKEVPDDQCRYAAGVILPTEPSAETAELLKSKDLSQHTFPNIDKAFMTDFPVTSFLSLYLMIWKVYHNMENHLKHKNAEVASHPCIELYGYVPGQIRIFFPVEKDGGFLLPEFSTT